MAEIGDYFGPMEPDHMTDLGMWLWAALITVAILVVAFVVAVYWQKWRDGKKQQRT